jgi:hypothetical protein
MHSTHRKSMSGHSTTDLAGWSGRAVNGQSSITLQR